MKKRLITSALPYVNNVPHLGNLIQVLSADAFARFCRLRGYETCYVCGTDEYGTATETRAAEEGVSPRQLCDRYWAVHDGIYRWFNINFDKFGRTSTPLQTEIVQDIFKRLDAAGFISEKSVEQSYCPACRRFLADRYVRGDCPHCGSGAARGDQCEACGKLLDPTELKNARCATCGAAPELRETRHLYIDLPQIKERLEKWLGRAEVDGRWARNAVQMTRAWIRDGLHERAITRDLSWGIPVPKAGFENKVFYVWFDAPVGYVSITANLGHERGGDWRAFTDGWWKNPQEVELFQFIGKDNIPFHTVIFPSSQLGTGEDWTMLYHMSSTEYLNYESGKFSKSSGVGVFGTDVMETGIESDIWRFYIYYNRPEKADTLFTWKDFGEKVNGELIGNLGNLVNRTLTFVTRYYDGAIPALDDDEHSPFWEAVRRLETEITEKLEWAELRDAYRLIFELSSFANKAFQDGEPWKARVENPAAAAALIGRLCYVVRDLAVLISPYTPAAAEKIARFLGLTQLDWQTLGTRDGLSRVESSETLWQKIDDKRIAELREKYAGSQKSREAAAAPVRIDLRVAEIVRIERHPKADKLYIETLEIAGEERVIVSGLVPHYKEEELLGKRIIVVYNLKEAKLRGVASKGMLLAASQKNADGSETVEVLDAGSAPTGSRVTIEGEPDSADALPEIDIDAFFSVPICAAGGVVTTGGKRLFVNGAPLVTKTVLDGEVG